MDYRNAFRHLHPFTRMLFLLLVMFISLMVVMALGMFLAIPFFDIDALSMLRGGDQGPQNLQFLRYVQLLSHIGLFVVPSVVFAIIVSRRPVRFMDADHRPGLWALMLCLLIMVSTLPMASYLNLLNQKMVFPEALKSLELWMRNAEELATEMVGKFLQTQSWQEFVFNFFLIAVIPAIGEEFIFRGILQKQFTQWTRNRHVAVIITAILFSAMHIQFFSFLPRFWLGLVLGYLMVYSGNIWYPVLAHFFNNAAALLVYHFYGMEEITSGLEDFGSGPFALILALSSLIVILALFVAFNRSVGSKAKRFR